MARRPRQRNEKRETSLIQTQPFGRVQGKHSKVKGQKFNSKIKSKNVILGSGATPESLGGVKYMYKVVEHADSLKVGVNAQTLEEDLNKYTQEGWELVQIIGGDVSRRLSVWKKKKEKGDCGDCDNCKC